MKIIRSRAAEWKLDTNKIGVIGLETIPPDAPPTFLVAASDDSCCATPVVSLLERYRKAKIPVEAHIYSQGDHAFNMGDRSKLRSIRGWPQRLTEWLYDNKWIPSSPKDK